MPLEDFYSVELCGYIFNTKKINAAQKQHILLYSEDECAQVYNASIAEGYVSYDRIGKILDRDIVYWTQGHLYMVRHSPEGSSHSRFSHEQLSHVLNLIANPTTPQGGLWVKEFSENLCGVFEASVEDSDSLERSSMDGYFELCEELENSFLLLNKNRSELAFFVLGLNEPVPFILSLDLLSKLEILFQTEIDSTVSS